MHPILKVFGTGFLVAVSVGISAFADGNVIVVDGERSAYSINISAKASKTDAFAARELQLFIRRSTGVELPIVVESRAEKLIDVGTPDAVSRLQGRLGRKFSTEESGYLVGDGRISIAGGGKTGNAYGVYVFLEQELGCRWFTRTGVDLVPKRKNLAVTEKSFFEKPRIPCRLLLAANHGVDGRRDSADHLFYFRNRINQIGGNYDNVALPELKGALVPRLRELYPQCHSFFKYLPVEKYFKEHPEWFSLIDGKRVKDRHLCFSNQEMCDELTKNLLDYAESCGGEGFLDLSQDDAGGEFCQCEGCQAAMRKYRTPAGKFFEYLHTLGAVAKARFPRLIIHTLAYHRDCTQRPPVGMDPFPSNIAIVFAPIDDDQFKSITHPHNHASFEDFKGWVRLAKVWLWDYPTLYSQPFGHLGKMAESIKAYADAGLTGTYVEHDWHVNYGGDFADMQTWLLMRAFRDPDLDWRTLRAEFCRGVYGAAADDMIAYEEDLERRRENHKDFVSAFGRSDFVFTEDDIVRWQKLFDGMELRVKDDSDAVQRLREVRLLLDATTLAKWHLIQRKTSGLGCHPRDVYDRATNTLDRAILYRYEKNPSYASKVRGCGLRKGLDNSLMLAEVKIRPLPDSFKKFPEDKIVQIFPFSGNPGHVVKVPMEDGALGFALKEIFPPDSKARLFPISVGMHEKSKNEYRSEILWLNRENAVFNRFHHYHLGKCRIDSTACYIWVGNTWQMLKYCSECYFPGLPRDWDVWVSLKIEGPDYDPTSKLKESGVYFDRIVLVGPLD